MRRAACQIGLRPTADHAKAVCNLAGVKVTLSLDTRAMPGVRVHVDDARARETPGTGAAIAADADVTLSWCNAEDGDLVIRAFAGVRALGRWTVPGALADGRAPRLRDLELDGLDVVDAVLAADLAEDAVTPRQIDWSRCAAVLVGRSPADLAVAGRIARDLAIGDVVCALADGRGRVLAAAYGPSDPPTPVDDAALVGLVDRLSAGMAGTVIHADLWSGAGCLQRLRAILAAAPPQGGVAIHHVRGSRLIVSAPSPIAAVRPFTVDRRRILFDDALLSGRPVEIHCEEVPQGDVMVSAVHSAAVTVARRTPIAHAADGALLAVGEPTAMAHVVLPMDHQPSIDVGEPRRTLLDVLAGAAPPVSGSAEGAWIVALLEGLRRTGRFASHRITLQPASLVGPHVEIDVDRAAALYLTDLDHVIEGPPTLSAAIEALAVSVEATHAAVRFVVSAPANVGATAVSAPVTHAARIVPHVMLATSLEPSLALHRLRLIAADGRGRPLPEHHVDWLEIAGAAMPRAVAPLLGEILPRMLDAAAKPRIERALQAIADALSGEDLAGLLAAATPARLGYALGAPALMRLAIEGRIPEAATWHLVDRLPVDEAEALLSIAAATAARSGRTQRFDADALAALQAMVWLRRPGKAPVVPPWLGEASRVDGPMMRVARLTLPHLLGTAPDPLAITNAARSLDAESDAALAGLMLEGRFEDPVLRQHVASRMLGARPEDYEPLLREDRRYECLRDFDHPPTDPSEVVCLIVARNEAMKLSHVVRHHQGLGVRHFVLIDNMSDDGTIAAFDGCNARVYRIDERYSRSRWGVAWINDVLSRDFPDRWVLVVDADEMLVYPDCETVPIDRLVRWLDASGYDGLEALMVDMYPDVPLEDIGLDDTTDLRAVYCWHDIGNYGFSLGIGAPVLHATGGVRDRLFRFGANAALAPIALNKVPLVRWKPGRRFLTSTHTLTPLRLPPFLGVLEHYKYLPDFVARARREALRREHWDGASEYAAYLAVMEGSGDFVFKGDASMRRTSGRGIVAATSPFAWPSTWPSQGAADPAHQGASPPEKRKCDHV